jgi:predicted nucleic acid-binding protein
MRSGLPCCRRSTESSPPSVLIEALGEGGSMSGELRQAIAQGERIAIPTLVLYEWLRGPRTPAEFEAQETLFPSGEAIPFATDEAILTAELHRAVDRARGREIDLAIAACAISWKAALRTLNRNSTAMGHPRRKAWVRVPTKLRWMQRRSNANVHPFQGH